MDTPCKANRGKHGCQEVVTDGGVENSGFCGDCWYPTIESDLNTFHELMAAGYSRSQAGIFSGLVKPDTREKLRLSAEGYRRITETVARYVDHPGVQDLVRC